MLYFIIALVCHSMLTPGFISYLLLIQKKKRSESLAVFLFLSVTILISLTRSITVGISLLNADMERAILWNIAYEIASVCVLPVAPMLLSDFLSQGTRHLHRVNRVLTVIGLILALFFIFIILVQTNYYLVPYSLQELPHPAAMGSGYPGPVKIIALVFLLIYDLYALGFALYSWWKNRGESFFTTLSIGIAVSSIILFLELLQSFFSRPVPLISQYFIPLDLLGLSIFALTALISMAQKTAADVRALLKYNRQLSLQQDKLKITAYEDDSTKLPNRQAFFHDIPLYFIPGFFLFSMDIDNLSFINLNHGYAVGDSVIKLVAQECTALKPAAANLYRSSADKFTILTIGGRKEVESLAEKILTRIAGIKIPGAEDIQLTVSIGIAEMIKERTEDITAWISQADTALKNAKQRRNCFVSFNPKLHLNEKRRLKIVEDLSKPLDQIGFHMNYQPVVDSSGLLTGAEALVRWKHYQLGMVSPDEFIPLAEATGYISRVTNFVLKQVAADHCSTKNSVNNWKVSINLSGKDLLDSNLLATIDQLTAECEAARSVLAFEVTETALIADWTATIEILSKLRDRGFPVALDDFGTGYSSLRYLKELPLNKLKIDRAFITDIPQDRRKVDLLDTIIKLGKNLGLELVIEGVENQDQLDFLRERNCDYYQGYYFSRPLSIVDFGKYGK